LKLKVENQSIYLLQVCALNAASEYQAFVDEVNDALLRVSPSESTILMGDFNAHIHTDTETWKGVIERYGVPGLNENGRYLLQLCCSNGLRIMNTFFSTQRRSQVYRGNCYRPCMEQKSMIDFCNVSADLFSDVKTKCLLLFCVPVFALFYFFIYLYKQIVLFFSSFRNAKSCIHILILLYTFIYS